MTQKNKVTSATCEFTKSFSAKTLEDLLEDISTRYQDMLDLINTDEYKNLNIEIKSFTLESDSDGDIELNIHYSRDYLPEELMAVEVSEKNRQQYAEQDIRRYLRAYPELKEKLLKEITS